VSQTYTFAFVDLAGFTALTDAHGDQIASDQVTRFTTLAQAALMGETVIVNVIGDAVLLAAHDVDDALATTLALLEACNAEPQFPLSRGGIHTGTAVRSGSDFFGAGVNVAARVTARAAGGELMLTQEPARVARLYGRTVHDLGSSQLRNVSEPVTLFRIDIAGGEQALDPVCRMTVARKSAAGTLTYQGHDYWFCSLECAAAFATFPTGHLPGIHYDG
jgi:adenylate cyclase